MPAHSIYHVKPTSSEGQALTSIHHCLVSYAFTPTGFLPRCQRPLSDLTKNAEDCHEDQRNRIQTSHRIWENGITETTRRKKLEHALSNVKTLQRLEAPTHCPAGYSRFPSFHLVGFAENVQDDLSISHNTQV
jgi:hypothetical protein